MNKVRDKIAFSMLMIVLAAPFTQVFFLTADDLLFYYYSMTWDWDQIFSAAHQWAVGQGRIGQYMCILLNVFGNYMVDNLIGRIIVVGLFFLSYIVIFVHVDQLNQTNITPLASIVLFAITPLSTHHFPPNSYPILISVPILIIGCLRIAVHRRVMSDAGGILGYAILGIFLAIFMLLHEYAMIIGGIMVIAVHLNWWMNCSKCYLTPGAPVRAALKMDFLAFVLVLVFYLGYRFTHPSQYEGSQLGVFHIMKILKIMGAHVVLGPSPAYLVEQPEWLEMISGAKNVVIFLAIMAASALLVAKYLDLTNTSRIYNILTFGLVFSAAVILPIAMNEKYQRWCLENVDCAYIDSRLSLVGVSLVISATMAVVLKFFEKGRVRDTARFIMSFIIGLLCATTFLFNINNIEHLNVNQKILHKISQQACSDRRINIESNKSEILEIARDIPWGDWTPKPQVSKEEFVLQYYKSQSCSSEP